MSTLDGKVALVSGAGRGIGRAIALKLADQSARLGVNGLDPERAEETTRLIESAGGDAVAVIGSVTDNGFTERFVQAAVDSYDGVDIVVNNAGHTWDSVIQKLTDEQWDLILDVHLRSPFRILRAVRPVMSARAKHERARGVRVHRKNVNVSSGTGVGGNAGQVNYAAAKAGRGNRIDCSRSRGQTTTRAAAARSCWSPPVPHRPTRTGRTVLFPRWSARIHPRRPGWCW
ncbi:SDR family NAD(P)-dependent oxidoreductase [Nonomuraea sp. NPDC051941]|uniref:SDR family NAD(P)-dependent oxidoreductase n=1 Tax=Nonomuraea sp. NPDC051941 TaxID=3364373 RepID=UPI0037C95953